MQLVPVYVSDELGAKVLAQGGLPRLQFEAAIERMLEDAERKARHAAEMRMARYARSFGWRW